MRNRLKRNGFNIILSAASGVGKSTIIKKIIQDLDNIEFSISATTREPRSKETPNVDYYFKTKKEFYKLIESNSFLEYAEVFGNFYGTIRKNVETNLAKGIDVIFDLDWQGADQVIKQMPEQTISIFILPPSMKELKRRLISRGQDNNDIIFSRMSRAKSEMSHYALYDYIIINDDFDSAIQDVKSIINANRLKQSRFIGLEELVQKL